KERKRLEEEVARSGLGADLQPVPEPTVRDLSLPQPKPSKSRKQPQPEPAPETLTADGVEIIPAREVAAATTAEVLGKKSEPTRKQPEPKTEPAAGETNGNGSKTPDAPAEPEIRIDGVSIGRIPARGKKK